MTYEDQIRQSLFELKDEKYKTFSAKLIPNIDPDLILGVRVPTLRALAKKLKDDKNINQFLSALPHKYLEENSLHAYFIAEIKDFDTCMDEINKFLPYIDNWATCDTLTPKCFAKNLDKLFKQITLWLKSNHTYTIRFAIEMLMTHFLDEHFDPKQLKLVADVKSNEYYVNMMIAWYFATALAKQYNSTIKYIENAILDKWTHNKTIQKAIESYRITTEQKAHLRSLKIK